MLNVMIVDDSLIIRKKLKKMLLELECSIVAQATNGREAVKLYEQYAPDLVTMDITMPLMDGISATKQINEKFPNANIVMITSHGQEDMVKDAIRYGAKGYVLKPITKEKLFTSIDKIFHIDKELLED
jgi:two-component system chemotaxis response regulator CheY